MKLPARLWIIFISVFIISACHGKNMMHAPKSPDYSQDRYWSVKTEKIIHPVDVFFVHPTTYGPPANGNYIADLADEHLNMVTDRDTINWITAAFSESCNVFAPRYRQMNIAVMKMSSEKKEPYMEIPVSDISSAFRYYLNNLNQGRPFILASHSQGSNVLQMVLLAEPQLLDHKKLVAAYMPGWSFSKTDLNDLGLKLSEAPDQTGCLISWNTIGPGGISPTVFKGATCVNPLSWTTTTDEVPASKNMGAKIFISPEKTLRIKNFTAAKINAEGALEIPSPPAEIAAQLNMSLGKEVYHRYDYDFFFNNIRENVSLRCSAYLTEHKMK
ncbi:DUF3089 domain-containing protein [Maridesulfovibrio bastinii]|uniref:DUF3089 domain-containing protein n=1 Tax=Maridesulfovibrio bastinii TaxID=47157 RepID=UPI00042553E4|nr:DUF3089 domain-containing protein [Maridesulfovibrio bastinii]